MNADYPHRSPHMPIIAFLTNAADVKRMLEHIGKARESPPASPSRAPPKEDFEFGPENDADVKFDFDQRVEYDDDTVV